MTLASRPLAGTPPSPLVINAPRLLKTEPADPLYLQPPTGASRPTDLSEKRLHILSCPNPAYNLNTASQRAAHVPKTLLKDLGKTAIDEKAWHISWASQD